MELFVHVKELGELIVNNQRTIEQNLLETRQESINLMHALETKLTTNVSLITSYSKYDIVSSILNHKLWTNFQQTNIRLPNHLYQSRRDTKRTLQVEAKCGTSPQSTSRKGPSRKSRKQFQPDSNSEVMPRNKLDHFRSVRTVRNQWRRTFQCSVWTTAIRWWLVGVAAPIQRFRALLPKLDGLQKWIWGPRRGVLARIGKASSTH